VRNVFVVADTRAANAIAAWLGDDAAIRVRTGDGS
jgi:hypothetical protein